MDKWKTWDEVLLWVVHMYEVYASLGVLQNVPDADVTDYLLTIAEKDPDKTHR